MSRHPRRNAGKPQSADVIGHLISADAWAAAQEAGEVRVEGSDFVPVASPEDLAKVTEYPDGELVVLVVEPALLGRSYLKSVDGEQRVYSSIPVDAVMAAMPAAATEDGLRIG